MSANYNDCYPGMQVADEACYRFTDKSIQESERFLYSNWWREEINQFGVKVKYFVNICHNQFRYMLPEFSLIEVPSILIDDPPSPALSLISPFTFTS